MIHARQHPHLEGSFGGPDYEWAPAGCQRKWCGGCGSCEAQTSWGYQLGYPAWTCSQVPCGPNTNYTCTLDGYPQRCDYPNGWVPAN